MSSKLRNLRTGTPPHKTIVVGNTNKIKVSVVILSADVALEIEEKVQEYCSTNDKKVNDAVRAQFYNALLAYHCMRDPDNLNERMVDNVAEVMEYLDLEDISRVVSAYAELMMNKAPKLELLTNDELNVIKNHLEVTPLSDLSTVLLVHLANCHQTIVSES